MLKVKDLTIEPLFREVNFCVPRGEIVTLMGPSGSGKSTLMHLLDRLYDLPEGSGRITIGGVDIREISRSYLRGKVGIVLQEPFLFSRTIAENIRATRPGASLEAIRTAAGIACVDEAIDGFSSGYDTIVGERGVTLSGGQKQRVAIARALVNSPAVLLADEPSGNLDTRNKEEVHRLFFDLRERLGQTIVLVTHDESLALRADRRIVMSDGLILPE